MTVPNLITTIRIILTPIFVIYFINDQFVEALIVFVICGVSDGLDGFVARVFHQKSKLGSYLDPLADKLLLVAAFVVLAIRGFFPPWLTVLVISRDVMILFGVLVLSLIRLEFSVRPIVLSKIATCFQFASVIAVLSKDYFQYSSEFYLYIFWATALFTVSSGLHYMHQWFKMMGEGSDNSQ